MFNSLFKKMTFIYLIVIVLSMAILGISLINMLENYYFDKKKEALIEEGRMLNDVVIQYLNREVSYDRLTSELRGIERFLNTKIWVVDRLGYIYGVSNEAEREWVGKKINKEAVLHVLEGRTVTRRGDYDEIYGSPVLTVGVPIVINGQVETAVFMHTPIYEIKDTLYEIYKLIIVSMMLSLIIATLILYFVSQRISRPVSEINQITKEIASGDFHKRVVVKSEDEIGQLASSFNYMAGELEKIEGNRREFIANVSHELRSPLTLIKGYVKGVVDMDLTEGEKDQYLNIVLEETDKLKELVNNLLNLSKMESGEYPLNKKVFDVNELIRRLVIKYDPKFEEKSLDISVHFGRDPLLVIGDRDSISQVLVNIIDNAVKFMEQEDSLTLSTELRDEKAYIIIEDTGSGISKENLEHIWKRFYKGDKSRSRQVTGTGLGLSIVKEIIKSHHQRIWVDSEVGKGTKFTFTLELAGKE